VGAIISDKSLSAMLPHHIPIVLVDACAYDGEFDSIQIDNFHGAYNAVSHLIEQGHRAIGLIGSSTQAIEHPSIRDRRRGYLQALKDHAIERSYMVESSLHSPVAQEAARKLLTENPEVTAIFACNDQIAGDIIPLAESLGRCVPHDLSICGFDDLDVAARITPPLTTIQVDRSLMGMLAVRHLYDRAAMLDRPPITSIIGTKLVVRDSVAKVNKKARERSGS
jgi:LacI family transcriptional regulator